ncbi:uncharacterized protein LOC110855444 isoform X1 [Folsomia candida]|uniref:uncharacterized protein LOC110855444 isoform X1 n=1 Tax=Folsomia candida TaxID=158441 RepID=UPI0016050D89|nr:uncharacterized protein LOC110855444 isoform X1 [Folsomia candida]
MNNRSPVIIPRKRLNLWSIFRDVGPEVENILSSAKLAHVGEGKGFVVTLEDDTYSYISDVNNGEVNVTRIPELSRVRVKEFFVGSIFLALTDDGALYSWINDHPMRYGVLKCDEDVKNLGRIQPGTLDWSQPDLTTLLATPHLVGGALTEKKVQTVALSFRGRVMALTTGGEVYQWGERGPHGSPEPVLIAQQHFHRQAVISIACTDHISVAINFSGELFQWELENKVTKRAFGQNSQYKKITASRNVVFALRINGVVQCLSLGLGLPLPTISRYCNLWVQVITRLRSFLLKFVTKLTTPFVHKIHPHYAPLLMTLASCGETMMMQTLHFPWKGKPLEHTS